jgi:predicted transcriptional regulator
MIHWLKQRSDNENPPGLSSLGHLETEVMEILWLHGDSNVHQVVEKLERELAYTTVMTTLDRLYKKGLLDRRKSERAFIYSARLSRNEWEHKVATDFVAGYLERPQPARELLISCLVEAVGQRDQRLLDELEKKIQMKRKQLEQREKK